MICSYLIVAVSDNEHGIDSIDPATKKLQQVECSFIRPVNVFDNRYGWRMSVRHLIKSGRKDRSARSFFFEQRKQLALSLMGYVVERAERARRKQRIARAPQNARLRLMRFDELLHKRRLADSRLAAYKHDSAITC